jgi:hypothetical protein
MIPFIYFFLFGDPLTVSYLRSILWEGLLFLKLEAKIERSKITGFGIPTFRRQ